MCLAFKKGLLGRRLNVVVVAACPFPAQRGTPVRILRSVESLCRRGHRVHVVTYHFGEEMGPVSPFIVHRTAQVGIGARYDAGPTLAKLLVLDPLLTLKLFRVLREHPIDIIHAHHYEGLLAAFSVSRIIRRPVVYDAHTTLASELPSYNMPLPFSLKLRLGRMFDRWLPRRADHIIAVSSNIEKGLVKAGAYDLPPISVIGNGVEAELFCKDQENSQVLKDGTERIIYAGNTAYFQNIDLLLEAFERLRRKRKQVRLMIVSDGSLEKVARILRDKSVRESVDLINTRFQNLPYYLGKADVAVNPRTVCDGMSLKMLNYMAAGKAIVSFAGSSTPVEHGVSGWVVESGDVEAFSSGIIELLSDRDLARRLGENARRLVREGFTWDAAAEKIEEVYYRVLGAAKNTCHPAD